MNQWADMALAWARNCVAPVAAQHSVEPSELRGLLRSAAQQGLLGMQVSPEYGGLGLPFSAKVAVAQAIARVDFGMAMAVVNTHNVAEQIVRLERKEMAHRLIGSILSGDLIACTALTEPGAGSDFSGIQTRAVPIRHAWQLDGAKSWIINANHADVVVVYAQTQADAGGSGIAAFLVHASQTGFSRTRDSNLSALCTMGVGGFELKAYRCTPEEIVSPAGEAFKDIMRSINGARTYVAAMCVGMLEECLHIVAAHGRSRHAFGQTLASHQGWRWALAQASVDLQAARHLVSHATACMDAQGDAQGPAAHAKVFATRMAQQHIAALMHAMGAEGLHDRHPFVRHLKAAQAATLTDGPTEMLLERIARETIGPFRV